MILNFCCFLLFLNWKVQAEEEVEEDGVALTRDTVMLSSHLPLSLMCGVEAEITEEDFLSPLALDHQAAAAEMQTFHRTDSLY